MWDLSLLCQWLSYQDPNQELMEIGKSFVGCESGGSWLASGRLYAKSGSCAAGGGHTRPGKVRLWTAGLNVSGMAETGRCRYRNPSASPWNSFGTRKRLHGKEAQGQRAGWSGATGVPPVRGLTTSLQLLGTWCLAGRTHRGMRPTWSLKG